MATPPPPDAPDTPSDEAVRKTVTVLFADLGGSTGFGERTDPETARSVMARYHATMREAVETHGGRVAKFIGDGVMAVWGVPEITEDDAARAVTAGAAMQASFAPFADDVAERHGERLTLRVGINTGEVVIADSDADMVGDALNVAARLEKECAPGHVLVGEETWRLTRGAMRYESLGSVSVSGRAGKVGIHQLVTPDVGSLAEESTPFVGRNRELARLRAALDDAIAANAPRFVTVLGSPGVGKTRLARELTGHLDDETRVLETRCDRAGEATFAPIVDLIRNAVDLDGLDPLATRDAIGSLLSDAVGDDERRRIVDAVVGLTGVASSRSTEETFWALRRMVESVAGSAGLVLVIDDIQWAEPLLLDLLEHLAEWVTGTPFLLVALARPELREIRTGLTENGHRLADVISLDGLDAAATEQLAARLLDTDRLPIEIVDRLPSSTDGNPLFVRELVRMLVDDHVIEQRDGRWVLAIDAEAVEVPPTIQSLLATRVERLPADERTLLELASVIGSEFNLGALRELSEPDTRDDIVGCLERLRRKELVEPAGTYWGDEPVHRFHHVLIRDATYRRLLKAKRADLHERVARWTDDAALVLAGEHEAGIAHHYEQAHDYLQQLGPLDEHGRALGARAADLLIKAADRALGREDLPAAGGLATRAVALSEEDGALAEAALLIACEALLASGDVRAAAPLVKRLTSLAGDDRRLGAWASCFDAQVIMLTDPDRLAEAEGAVTGGAAALAELTDQAGLAKAHLVRAGILARLGQVGACEVELDLALGAARTVDDHRRVTAVLGAAPAAALWGPSPLARAGGRCLDVVRLLRITAASPSVEASSMRTQAVLEALRGRFDTARSMLERSRAPLAELGLQHGLLETDLFAGIIELVAGNPVAAEPLLRAAYGGLGALGVGADAGQAAALLAGSLLAQGRVDDADEMASASEAMAGQNLKTGVAWRAARAQILSVHGDHDRAVAMAEDAVRIAEPTDLLLDHADACAVLAQVRDAAGDRVGAADARAEAGRLYRAKGASTLADRLADEMDAEANPASGTQRPQIRDNEATRAAREVVRQWMAGELDGALARYAADYEFVDRRQGLGDTSSGREAMREQFEVILELLDGDQFEVFDVVQQRGEHLTLFIQGVNGKIQLEMLSLMEFDAEGHATYACIYDMADLDVAIADLDARDLAQRTRPGAPVVGNLASRAARRTLETWMSGDLDGARACFVKDTLFEDRRRGLQSSTTSLDGMIEQIRVLLELQDEHGIRLEITEIVAERGDHLTVIRQGTYTDDVHVDMLCLSEVDTHGRAVYNCMYDVDDIDRAIADLDDRYGPIGAARKPALLAENAASRIAERQLQAYEANDRAALAVLFHPSFERIDRRSGPVGPPVASVDDWVDRLLSFREVGFVRWDATPWCMRGDRLALVHIHSATDAGDVYEALQLLETGGDGRIVRVVDFAADALVDAYSELSERYAVGDGAEHAEQIRIDVEWTVARHRRDWSRLTELSADDMVYVDHRPLKWGSGDWSTYLANEQSHVEVVPDLTVVSRVLRHEGDAAFCVADMRGTEPGGDDFIDTLVAVSTTNRSGSKLVCDRIEMFSPDVYDEALARFHELAGISAQISERSILRAENLATRATAQGTTAWLADERDPLIALHGEPFERRSQRSGPVGPQVTTSVTEWVDQQLSFRDVGFDRVEATPWCVRGERLALVHLLLGNEAGDEYQVLQLVETDDAGLVVRVMDFDVDAFADAYAELAEWYAAGEGSDHADNIRLDAASCVARQEHDWESFLSRCAEDLAFVDHRPLRWGAGDRATLLANEQSHFEAVPDLRVVNRTMRYHGDALLQVADVVGTEPRGGPATHTLLVVSTARWAGSGLVCDRVELFGEDDLDAALARLDALGRSSIERRPPSHPPRWDRTLRFRDLMAAGSFDEAADLLDPEFTRVDRRRGVSDAVADRAAYLDAWRSLIDVGFQLATLEPVAWRGEGLTLFTTRYITARGDEMAMLTLWADGPTGKLRDVVLYDIDDFATAMRDLDRRYLAGEGAEHGEVIDVVLRSVEAYADRDWPRLASLRTDDFEFVDHRPLSWGRGDKHLLETNDRSLTESIFDMQFVMRTIEVDGPAALGTLDFWGTTTDGATFRRTLFILSVITVVDGTGLTMRSEYFEEDQHAEARARFELLARAEVPPPPDGPAEQADDYAQSSDVPTRFDARTAVSQPPPTNRAVETIRRFIPPYERGDWTAFRTFFADDLVMLDHRTAVRGEGATTGDGATDVFRSVWETGWKTLQVEPIAVRGDRLDLHRTRFVHPDGFHLDVLGIIGVDDAGLVREIHTFDPDDLRGGLEVLDHSYLHHRSDP